MGFGQPLQRGLGAGVVDLLLGPDQPLLPNYKWVPIGYHGRSSSIVVSGTPAEGRSVDELELSVRSANCLKNADIHTFLIRFFEVGDRRRA